MRDREVRRSTFRRSLAPALLGLGVGEGLLYLAHRQLILQGAGDLSLQLALFPVGYLIWVGGLTLALPGFDGWLPALAAVLYSLGLAELGRLAPALAERLAPFYGTLPARQALWWVLAGLGGAVLAGFLRRPAWLFRYKYSWAVLGALLVLATFLFGVERNGARLWIVVGPLSMQPSELLKVALAVFLAAYLAQRRELATAGRRLGPLLLPPLAYLVPLGVMVGLTVGSVVVQRDLGAALLLFGVFLTVLYGASGRLEYVLGGLALFAGAAAWAAGRFPHVAGRVAAWRDPWAHATAGGYQLVQGFYALASGGLLGRGVGGGIPYLIPEPHTDLIPAALGEEWGAVGLLALLLLYGLLAVRGLAPALRPGRAERRLLALGLTVTLLLQAILLLGGVLDLFPLTGIPLPFVSYGGSSLGVSVGVVTLLAWGSRDR